MRYSHSVSVVALATGLIIAFPSALAAQDGDGAANAERADAEAGRGTQDANIAAGTATSTIVVTGASIAARVDTSQAPVLELDEDDIAAYGAGSIAELLQALGPQLTSARGRGGGMPVILVNGNRISSFRELRSYPPEAIERFEVFPEEVALEYGYSPDQRVVNIILKNQFSSRELEFEFGQPFDGGFSTQEVEATYLRVAGDSRLNINLEWNNSSTLTEADRNIIQSGNVPDLASDPDPAAYRSLVSDSAGLEATVNWSTSIGRGKSLSFNATFERDDSLRLQGLDTVLLTDMGGNSLLRSLNANDPLTIDSRSETYAAGASANLGLGGGWQLATTLDGSHVDRRSLIQRRADTSGLVADAAAGTLAIDGALPSLADAGFDEALTSTDSASLLSTLTGNPIYLPAGDVSLTIDAGFDWNRIESEDTRNPGAPISLKRGDLSTGINLGIPLTSRFEEVLGAVGDISLNLSAGINHLSDFGSLYDWNAGVTWGLTDTFTLSASYINRDTAPSLGQLGNPEMQTLNVPVFDLINNETVLATVISGGNPLLPAQNQSDWKFSATWEMAFLNDARISVDYINNTSTNVTQGFPVLTPEIEAAFSDRITRDSFGTLVQIDQRPVTYAEQRQERLQFNFNISGQIGGGADEGDEDDQDRGADGARTGAAAGAPVAMGGAPSAAPGGFGGGFSSGRGPGAGAFAQIRATFCAAEPEMLRFQLNEALASAAAGEAPPEGMNVPPQMLQRIAGDDGQVDAQEIETIRGRMCSGDGPPAGGPRGAGPAGGFAGGPAMFGTAPANVPDQPPVDAEQMERQRAIFCEADDTALRAQFNAAIAAAAQGQALTAGVEGEEITIAPEMLLQLGGEDAHIDEDEYAVMKLQVCNPDAAGQSGQPGATAGPGGQGGQGGQGAAAQSGQPQRGQADAAQPQNLGAALFGGGGRPSGPPPGASRGGGGGPGAGRGRGGAGRGGGRGGFGPRGPGGRWFFNLQYNLELNNEVLVAPGGPSLDLLDGDAIGSTGQPRHTANFRLGTFFNGFGMFWNGRYIGSSTLDGTGLPGSTDLAFGDYVTFDVRLFADLGQRENLVEAVPLLADSRVSIGIDNIFDARQSVTDSNGDVPLRYQPFLIDPVGRSFEIEFRKLF